MRFTTLRFFSLPSSTSNNLFREGSPNSLFFALQEMARARQQERALYPNMYRGQQNAAAAAANNGASTSSAAWQNQIDRQQRSVLKHYSQFRNSLNICFYRDYSAIQEQTKKNLQLMQQLQAAQRAQANNQPEEIVIDGSPTFSAAPVKTYQVDEGSCHL